MNRKRKAKQIRKFLLKVGTDYKEEILNKDDDGEIIPDKKDWGYGFFITVNGRRICAVGRDRYTTMKGAHFAAKWALEQPYYGEPKGSTIVFPSIEFPSDEDDEEIIEKKKEEPEQ